MRRSVLESAARRLPGPEASPMGAINRTTRLRRQSRLRLGHGLGLHYFAITEHSHNQPTIKGDAQDRITLTPDLYNQVKNAAAANNE